MAANPLLACGSATSWYDFTYPLSWSNECEVAEVLSDIPFISVGILVFGVSTLFLVMKRISLSTLSLFFSTLLAFIAAVLDLAQTLADGMAVNATFVAKKDVIRAREVLLALSIGFRFLFYWSYVAEPSRKDLSAAATQRVRKIKFLGFECTYEPYSASWVRLGLSGKLIGAGLLVAIVIISMLQIVWRVVPQFHQYGNVYAADVALELLLSLLLLLKLLSNTVTLNSVDSLLVRAFGEHLAPISGLLVNIAIGVGDLLCFAFTESTAGRLLQAFEVYIIVVFVMVAAFLRHRDLLSTTLSQGEKRREVAFRLPEPTRGSVFRITPPLIETPRMSTIYGITAQSKISSREILCRSARRSLNQVPSWLPFRISRRRSPHEDEEVKLWNAGKAKEDPPYTGGIDTEMRTSIVSTQAYKTWPEHVHDASAIHPSIISALNVQSATAGSIDDSIHSGQILHASRADVQQRTIPLQVQTGLIVPVPSVPLSVAKPNHAKGVATSAEASPIYGLGCIQSLAGAPDSRTSSGVLLRQRNQPEQTMDTPRLFFAETSTKNPLHSNSVSNPELTRSPSTGQRTVCSDVSLSNFPIPPMLTTPAPLLPVSTSPSIKRIRGDRRVRLAAAQPALAQDTNDLVPPRTLGSPVDIPSSPYFNSIPHTPTGEENESLSAEGRPSHSDARATQYNVTSFIGDLAIPGRFGDVQTGSDVKKSRLFRSSGLPQGGIMDVPGDITQYQTNEQTCQSLTLTNSPQIPVVGIAKRDTQRPSARTRIAGSPTAAVSAKGGDRLVQKTFVRRRPPPLIIQSYREHHPGACRVQVLADD